MGMFGDIARENVREGIMPVIERLLRENESKPEAIKAIEEIKDAILKATAT
ncbi:MAG TPA: hypothetical protein VI432_02930 [Candidatus Paceibacterota bacterium]